VPRDLFERSSPGGLAKTTLLEICTEILPWHEVSYKDLANRALIEILYRSFIKRSCTETLHRDLLGSCQKAPYRDLAKRPLLEILHRDLARTPLMETLHRDIAWGSCCRDLGLLHNLAKRAFLESLHRDLIKRSCPGGLAKTPLLEICAEILPWGLLQRSCQQSSYRDLVQRSCQETSFGDLVQRPGEESRGLVWRYFWIAWTKVLLFEVLTKIFCGDLL